MKKIGIAYFDCFSGIGGDMILGALFDAGCRPCEMEVRSPPARSRVGSISSEKVVRRRIRATQVKVANPTKVHSGTGHSPYSRPH